jgi:hypothetical protein
MEQTNESRLKYLIVEALHEQLPKIISPIITKGLNGLNKTVDSLSEGVNKNFAGIHARLDSIQELRHFSEEIEEETETETGGDSDPFGFDMEREH